MGSSSPENLLNDMDLFPLYLTIKVSLIATLLVSVIGIAIAYVLARMNFPAKNLLDALILLPLVFPPTVTGYYLIVLFGKAGIIGKYIYDITGFSITFTWQAAVLASAIVAMPFMIKTSRAALESVDVELEKVAFTLGKTRWETMLLVTFPLAKKGIFAGIVLSFARAMGEFGATLMFAGNIPGKTNTMPIAIYDAFSAGNFGTVNVLVLILTFVSIFILYLTNRLIQGKW